MFQTETQAIYVRGSPCGHLSGQASLVEYGRRLKGKTEQHRKAKTRVRLFHGYATTLKNPFSFHPHKSMPQQQDTPQKVNNSQAKFAKTSSWPTFPKSRCIKLWSVWARVKGEEERQSKQIAIQSPTFLGSHSATLTDFIQALPVRQVWFTKMHHIQAQRKL